MAEDAALVLWLGGLWITGLLVAPTLFATLDSRALAGEVAGRLFAAMGWTGLACGGGLLGLMAWRRGAAGLRSRYGIVVGTLLLLTVAGHFGIRPHLAALKAQARPQEVMASPLAGEFAFWHRVSTLLYGAQSLLGLGLLAVRRSA